MTDNSKENGIIKTCLLWSGGIAVGLLALLGLIIFIKYIMLLLSVEMGSSNTVTFDKIIVAVLVIGVFSFALFKIFTTKTVGFGPFTSSTLIITLTLMVVSIAFLFGSIDGQDITSVMLAIIGFVGGLVAGKSK